MGADWGIGSDSNENRNVPDKFLLLKYEDMNAMIALFPNFAAHKSNFAKPLKRFDHFVRSWLKLKKEEFDDMDEFEKLLDAKIFIQDFNPEYEKIKK